MDASQLERMLQRMARQIMEMMETSEQLALVGMQTRGVYVAKRLQQMIRVVDGVTLPLGILDTTMYRDDFQSRHRHPMIRATRIPFDVTERSLILVDDVLCTGRTVRAAMDALMHMGRPAHIRLLIVVDRGLRELPIRADIVGRVVPTIPGEEIRVRLKEVDDREGVWLVERCTSEDKA